MSHWKLTLSYDGSLFHGWQVQPGLVTVQSTLSHAIHELTGERVMPQGSGRTDAGVHALGQVASVTLEAPIPQGNLLRALNRILPSSVRVVAAEEVGPEFHARHSARRKTYEYRIFERRVRTVGSEFATERTCSPFVAPFVWDCRWPVELSAMEQAAAMFVGTMDFTSFAASDPDLGVREDGSGGVNPVKTIFESAWERREDALVYRVVGSGFLHHMVRNLVGTMVDVGRGAIRVEDLPGILAAKDRSAAGPTAPAKGLFLVSVLYER